MAAPSSYLDRRFLLASIYASAVLGTLGIVWGIATRSQMILLDGAYAVIGILLSVLLLGASSLSSRGPSRRHPFGMEGATPLAVSVQGLVLLATLLYAMYEAVLTIRSGGSDVTAGWATAYGVVVTVASGAFTVWISRAAGTSDVLIAEATAWRVAVWRGVGMIVGFGALAVVEARDGSRVAPYIDPAMVLISCAALFGAPLAMIRDTGKELLEAAPPDEVQRPIAAAVAAVGRLHGLDDPTLYVTKLGGKVYVEVAAEADGALTITDEQAARDDLRRRLADLPYDIWLNVELSPRSESGRNV